MNISINITLDTAEVEQLIERLAGARGTVAAPTSPEPGDAPITKKRGKPARETPVETEAQHLAAGPVAWTVEVDGVPTRWMLDYTAGKLPATRGGLFCYQGKQYRITKIYGTMLHTSSIESIETP